MGKIRRKNLKIGSKLIEGGTVYRVFKIKNSRKNGEADRIIYYKPYFKNDINRTITCSIPESSIEETLIRKPISKEEAEEVLKKLASRTRRVPLDVNRAKTEMVLNDIYITVKIVKRYWREKLVNSEGFSKTKKNILEMALDKVVEELAIVNNTSLGSAEEKVLAALGN